MKLKFDPADPKYEYIKTLKEAGAAVKKLAKEKIIAVDIETTGFDPYRNQVLLVQVGSSKVSYIFDAREMDIAGIKGLKELLENKKVIKLLQNGKFDYKFIKIHFGISIDNIYDTMLAEGILRAGLGSGYYGLKDLAQDYTEIDLKKEIRETFEKMGKRARLSKSQLRYAAMDTLILFPIFEKQIEKLRAENLVNIAKLEFAVTRVVAEMELKGLFLDEQRWRKIIGNLSKKRDKQAAKFQSAIRKYFKATALDLFGNEADSININSQVQLMNLFNKKIGVNIPSTGDYVLAGVDHPVARILREYRSYEKLVSAFGERLLKKINKKTGRIHPDFNQLGTATGRFSCNNPNLQQIPRYSEEAPFRACFNPAPGYKLVTADYSSIEMVILADLSGDPKMVKALNDDLDIHSYTASLMFGKEYTPDFKKKFPELRQISKPIGFGLMYGMGPQGLARQIDVSVDEAEKYMDKYFSNYPSVKKFLDKMAKGAVRNGCSKTKGGRKRWYKKPDPEDPDYRRKISRIEREAKNHPIQGTSADAIKYALVFIQDRLVKEGVDGAITHTVHDEIVTEIREDQAEDFAKIQMEEMIRAAQLFIKKVKVKSDPFIGDVWEH